MVIFARMGTAIYNRFTLKAKMNKGPKKKFKLDMILNDLQATFFTQVALKLSW